MYHQKPLTGVKGRIQSRSVSLDEDTNRTFMELVSEKVTYFSINRKTDD